MHNYRRVTYEDRCHISAFLQANFPVREISIALGFHTSTIYREIRRNKYRSSYDPERATVLAAKRFRRCRRRKVMTRELAEKILVYAEFGWSPEQIAGRLKQEKSPAVSRQTIYRSFGEKTLRQRIIRKNRRRSGGRATQRKSRRTNRVIIHERPSIVEQRRRIGDWERDGMYGANRKQLLVLTDRKTRYTKLRKIEIRTSKEVSRLTLDTLGGLGKRVFTMTNDNGTEFNDSASLPFRTYHCEPYKPQQRGTVENTIGLLREYIKRNTDLDKLTANDLQIIENKINFRPRKCLGFRTPFEVFFNRKVALAL
ncbi:MAG: IS30 family transposase [Bdellovibrionaceae bacterium]|nr:IS30 family transposase [Bdellovibrionales bacterium]MCB9086296.1 IS30 family transposase [Pseudobdellovibrionaceae bacterium]